MAKGLVNQFSNRLFGQGFDPSISENPNVAQMAGNQAWMAAAASLLRSGENPFATFGGSLGRALTAGQQGFRDSVMSQAQRELLGARTGSTHAREENTRVSTDIAQRAAPLQRNFTRARIAGTQAQTGLTNTKSDVARAGLASQQALQQALQQGLGGTGAGGGQPDPDAMRQTGARLMQLGQTKEGKRLIDSANAIERGGQTETQREIQSLVGRGIPEAWAEDVAHGNVSTQQDQFGNVLAINRATGEVRTLRGPGAQTAGASVSVGEPQVVSEDDTGATGIFSVTDEATGPVSGARSFVDRTVGPFFEAGSFPDTESAKTNLRLFNQTAKTALVNNPRFPVAEQNLIRGMLPDPDSFFANPESQRARAVQLRQFLTDKLARNQSSIQSGNITQKELGDLSNQNESIRRVLEAMGHPAQAQEQPAVPGPAATGGQTVELNGKTYIRRNGQWFEQ